MKSEAQKLGSNLKKIRTKKSISQGDIARSLNVARSFVSDIENGKRNPTLTTITKLAEAIGVSTSELLK
ncbi:MAG: DNA-binding protein [Parcubacteria group bacterium 20-58-5]|nr:MAG: DNA-binding protein [Parcubacteria group bacterium 20-58-5]